MTRKSTLKIKRDEIAINADFRTEKLDPEELIEDPEIIRRDARNGQLVVRQLYDKATGEPLEEGYGYRWVNEDGEEVPTEDITYYQVKDEEEVQVTKHEPTLGSERTVTPVNWVSLDEVDEFLIEKTYEMWGEEQPDIDQFYELAEAIQSGREAPVIEVVIQPTFYKKWGIIVPRFQEDSFSLLIRVTTQRINPQHAMPLGATEEPAETPEEAAAESEGETIEQPSPFE